ncbi:di- and tripeptidase [Entomortierella parvispora]|uniref:Di- and tripeptidase n=1 Tax=Entomortierella parvispora TaxID=205924 RepID=A0A9P3H8X6_9FUNG|nr:di- and tripeptidase [Entomortierella parvispora]
MSTRQDISSLSRSSSSHGVSAQTSSCLHTLTQEENSVLSLAATEKLLFSGGQGAHGSDIHVWDLEHFQLKANLKGHLGSILSLTLREDGKWLFSSSGDGTVRVWDTTTFKCLYHIHSSQDVGDVFSVVFSDALNTMYIGCQNTSIQWFDFSESKPDVPHSPNITHSLRSHTPRFFEGSSDTNEPEDQVTRYSIPESCIYQNSHFGYVYCLLLGKVPNVEGEILFSGSGEGDIKLWKLHKGRPIELWKTLKAGVDASTLTLALHDGFLFCGSQGGNIKIFDLETFQLIRSLIAHEDDVLALVVRGSQVYSASADGVVKQWHRSFEPLQTWSDHRGSVLSLASTKDYLISGGSDKFIKLWSIKKGNTQAEPVDTAAEDVMLYALEKWIAMPTVSGVPSQLEECRRGAKFLKAVLQQLGAESRLIPGAPGQNPLVYGQFSARTSKLNENTRPLNVLVYGHYDVIAADSKKWDHPPFKLTGKDGYLYGRGASDNKGPILACIFAASELQEEQKLDVNVKFLIEGEEENGSVGFFQAVDQNIGLFEEADVILLSNSYWLGEDIPCLTYGLRGVIHSTLTINSKNVDLHSGVDGGAVSEPLIDMVKVLSELVNPDRTAKIPGFYDCIRPLTAHEDALYDPIVEDMFNNPSGQRHWDPLATGVTKEELKHKLMARWRNPSLTIHQVDVSGPKNRTVIPRSAKASVSMRIVPDQEVTEITKSFEEHVRKVFSQLDTENDIEIDIKVVADWWLGDIEDRFFKAAEAAIEQEWGQKPLFIREGGSVPAIRWLEKRLKAKAVHIPMGQSSDQAHLNNERIRLQNLNSGKRVVKAFLNELRTLEVAQHNNE